jgi:tetratricopeptide (TPR) repeat protein
MRSETKRRLIAYPIAVVVLSGLVYGGFVYEAEPDAFQLFNSAEILAKIGEFDKAIIDAERGLRQEPENRYAHIIVAYCYGEKGDYERSLEHYRRALELTEDADETRGVLRLHLAETLLEAGHPAAAESEARAVVEAEPGQHQAWHIIGKARVATGRLEDAREAYRTAAATASDDPTPLVLLAGLEEEQGRKPEAARHMVAALGRAPDRPDIRAHAVRLLCATERAGEAVEAIAAIPPESRPRLRRLLGQMLETQELLERPDVRELFAPVDGPSVAE